MLILIYVILLIAICHVAEASLACTGTQAVVSPYLVQALRQYSLLILHKH